MASLLASSSSSRCSCLNSISSFLRSISGRDRWNFWGSTLFFTLPSYLLGLQTSQIYIERSNLQSDFLEGSLDWLVHVVVQPMPVVPSPNQWSCLSCFLVEHLARPLSRSKWSERLNYSESSEIHWQQVEKNQKKVVTDYEMRFFNNLSSMQVHIPQLKCGISFLRKLFCLSFWLAGTAFRSANFPFWIRHSLIFYSQPRLGSFDFFLVCYLYWHSLVFVFEGFLTAPCFAFDHLYSGSRPVDWLSLWVDLVCRKKFQDTGCVLPICKGKRYFVFYKLKLRSEHRSWSWLQKIQPTVVKIADFIRNDKIHSQWFTKIKHLKSGAL